MSINNKSQKSNKDEHSAKTVANWKNYRSATLCVWVSLLAVCNSVFPLPVKSNSDEYSASARCNRAVIPADSWEEHPSINIHTPSNRFQTYPKSETIHHVPAHIFIWSESYPILTSRDASWDWHVGTGCFNQRHREEFFSLFSPLSFSFDDRGDLLTRPPLSCRLAWHQHWHDYS